MVNKLTITLAVLFVTLSVASTVCGLPAAQSADREELATEETTTAKTGVRGWIKGVYDKVRRPCNHTNEAGRGGGVVHWVKSKLGFVKTTTAAAPTSTTTVGSRDVGGVSDDRSQPEAGTPEAGDDRRPEAGDGGSSSSDAESGRPENGRPEIESGGESVGDDVLPPPADVADNDGNGFADGEVTPQSAATVDPPIDERMLKP